MAWTIVGIFGGFALGCLGLLTWVIGHLETSIGQRISEQGALFGAAFDRFERLVDTRFTEVIRRFDLVSRRFDLVDQRFDVVDGRLEQVEGRLERVEGRLERVEGRLEGLEEGFRGLRADLGEHISHHPA